MRVAHVSIYPEQNQKHSKKGGVASYTKNLVTSIPYSNEDDIFVLCEKSNEKYSKYKEDDLTIIRCFDKKFTYFFQLLKEIFDIKPDVIHFQQELSLYGNIFTAYLFQWLLLFSKKSKIIVTLHGVVSLKKIDKSFIKQNRSILPIFLVKLAFRVIYIPILWWSDKIIVHEDCFKKILKSEYGAKLSKIEVIHHGIEDLKVEDKMVARKNLQIDQNKKVILFMGYLTGYKGIDLLIDGFSDYAKKAPDAFLIIGAGKHPKFKEDKSYLLEYRKYIKKAEKKIPKKSYRWVGFIDEKDIKQYFSASDLSVYPYAIQMSSSGPMSLAIGYGTPFLASEVFCGVIPEKLIFARKKEDLASVLKNFFDDPNSYHTEALKMRKNRLWSLVGFKTYKTYINL